VLAACAIVPAAACVQVDIGSSGAGSTRLYAGAVRVKVPYTMGQVEAVDVSTLGVGVDGGVFLGWRRGQYVFVRPGECQLLIIIRSPIEAEHALSILRAAEGEQLCVVDFPGTLPSS
jgi:hypothetical protein